MGYGDIKHFNFEKIQNKEFKKNLTGIVKILKEKGAEKIVICSPVPSFFAGNDSKLWKIYEMVCDDLREIRREENIDVLNVEEFFMVYKEESEPVFTSSGQLNVELEQSAFFKDFNGNIRLERETVEKIVRKFSDHFTSEQRTYNIKLMPSIETEHLQLNKKLAVTSLKIKWYDVEMLIDTCAASSFMRYDFMELLQRLTKCLNIKKLINGPIIESAAGGDRPVRAEWICSVPITFKSGRKIKIEFLVAKGLTFLALIGNDTVQKYNMTVCAYQNNVTWRMEDGLESTPLKFTKKIFRSQEMLYRAGSNEGKCLKISTVSQSATIINNFPYSVTQEEARCINEKIFINLQNSVQNGIISEEQREMGISELQQVLPVFRERLGKYNGNHVKLEIVEAIPWKRKNYGIPSRYREAVKKEIEKMEKAEIIAKENTPYVHPIVIVPKKEGTIRVCVDAQALNRILKPHTVNPPKIQDILNQQQNFNFISKFDFAQGFLQLPLQRDACKLIGIEIDGVTYTYQRLPFGTSISSSVFMEVVRNILG